MIQSFTTLGGAKATIDSVVISSADDYCFAMALGGYWFSSHNLVLR